MTEERESESESETESSVDIDDEADDPRPSSVENTTPPYHDENGKGENGDETVPAVELDLYELSVRVSGQSTDDLSAVEDTARRLMEYLVEQSRMLEEQPDNRGLG